MACLELSSSRCSGVYDNGCHNREFYTCAHSKSFPTSKSSCVYTRAVACVASSGLCGCDFDSAGACGWSVSGKWRRGTRTPSGGTGAPSAQNGSHFMFIESSAPSQQGDISVLQSVALHARGRTSVAWYYYMYGAGTGSLVIEARVGAIWSIIWSKVGQQQRSQSVPWLRAIVELPKYAEQVRFSATVGSSITGDISIDSIQVLNAKHNEGTSTIAPGFYCRTSGNDIFCLFEKCQLMCVHSILNALHLHVQIAAIENSCTFESGMCGWHVTAGNNSQWRRATNRASPNYPESGKYFMTLNDAGSDELSVHMAGDGHMCKGNYGPILNITQCEAAVRTIAFLNATSVVSARCIGSQCTGWPQGCFFTNSGKNVHFNTGSGCTTVGGCLNSAAQLPSSGQVCEVRRPKYKMMEPFCSGAYSAIRSLDKCKHAQAYLSRLRVAPTAGAWEKFPTGCFYLNRGHGLYFQKDGCVDRQCSGFVLDPAATSAGAGQVCVLGSGKQAASHADQSLLTSGVLSGVNSIFFHYFMEAGLLKLESLAGNAWRTVWTNAVHTKSNQSALLFQAPGSHTGFDNVWPGWYNASHTVVSGERNIARECQFMGELTAHLVFQL